MKTNNKINKNVIRVSIVYFIIIMIIFSYVLFYILKSDIESTALESILSSLLGLVFGKFSQSIYKHLTLIVYSFNEKKFELHEGNVILRKICFLLLDILSGTCVLVYLYETASNKNWPINLVISIVVILLVIALFMAYFSKENNTINLKSKSENNIEENSNEENENNLEINKNYRSENKTDIEANMIQFKHFARRSYFQYFLAFLVAIKFGHWGYELILKGHTIVGTIFSTPTMISLVGLFIDVYKEKNK